MRDNPLWYREARLWRRPQAWASLLLYPLLLLAPTVLAWGGTEEGYLRTSALNTAFIFTLFGHLLYFCLRPLLATTGLIAKERERGTFEALATTRTTAREAVKVSLFFAVAPRLLELALFGWILGVLPGAREGTPPSVIPLVLLSTVPYILAYAGLGLWLSARARRTAAATGVGLLLLTLNFVGVVLVEIVVDELSRYRGPWLSWVVDPWVAAVGLTDGRSHEGAWLLCPLAHLLAAGWLYFSTVARLSRPESTAMAAPTAGRRWAVPGLSEHPVLYRELLRFSRGSLFSFLLYPVLVAAPGLLIHTLFEQRRVSDALAVLLALALHATWLAARAISAGSRAVALEREQRTWEPLLSTKLTGGEILRGKLLANLVPLLAPLVVFSPAWLLYTDFVSVERLLGMLVYSALLAVLLFVFSLWLSLRGRSATQVCLIATGALLTLSLGTICVDAVVRGTWCLSHLSPIYVTALYFEQSYRQPDLNWWLVLGPYAVATVGLMGLCRKALYQARASAS